MILRTKRRYRPVVKEKDRNSRQTQREGKIEEKKRQTDARTAREQWVSERGRGERRGRCTNI